MNNASTGKLKLWITALCLLLALVLTLQCLYWTGELLHVK